MNTLCFTGHRAINEMYHGPVFDALRYHLDGIVDRAINRHNVTNFISGGALGVDTVAGEAVIAAKELHDVKLIIARPFPSQDVKWIPSSRARYARMLADADKIHDCFPDPYKIWKMQGRNVWMVNQSNIVIAVWDGIQEGGTWNCVRYAFSVQKKRQMKIVIIHPTLLTEKVYSGKHKQEVVI